MSLAGRALTSDDVLLWFHGRRFGMVGDGQSGDESALMMDGKCIASNRMAAPFIHTAATSLSAAGAVTVAKAVVGDTVVSVIDCTSFTDVSADFESTISVAGQIQQLSSTSGHQVLLTIFPRS